MATTSHSSTRRSTHRPRSVAEWFRTRCRPLPWVLGASLLASGFPTTAFTGEPDMTASWIAQPGKNTKDVTGAAQAVGPRTKLMYTAATWEVVLRKLAEDTGSVLIADRVPAGRYSRRDKAEYSREEAVRIINREIEPLGFRVLEKGQYLIVLDLPSQRVQYQRPVVPPPMAQTPGAYAPGSPQSAPGSAPRMSATQITPVPPRGARPGPAAAASRSGVQLVSHEQPDPLPAEQNPARRHLLESDPPAAAVAPEAMKTLVFHARHQQAKELAKLVFRTFRDRAELVEAGRNGLPAFTVKGEAPASGPAPVRFQMAIDDEREELLIDAPAKEADALVKLLKRLDTPMLETEPFQLVASTKSVAEIAPQLPAQFAKIRAMREREGNNQFAQADPQAAPQQPPQPGQEAPQRGTVQDIVGNIKAEVRIEAIPDLGILILQGNEADVQQVRDLIDQLERLSEATAPRVHLLYLSHVNSTALAELLTTVYENLTKFPGKATQPRQNAIILPVVSPNAILIVAPESDLESIKELATQLDEPVDPLTEFEVFPLKFGIAAELSEKLTTLLGEEPEGLDLRVVIQPDERTNSLIVRGKPRELDQVASMIKKLDREASDTVRQIKVFTLKYAVATELAAVINAAIQSVLSAPSNQGASQIFGQQFGGGAGQVDEVFRSVASPVLELEGRRSGILSDIRITPDPQANQLIVAAPESSLILIEELIGVLDQPTKLVSEIKVFTLQFADAQLIVQQLQGLFNAQVVGGTQGGQGGAQQRQQLGVQIAGSEDSGLIPMRFSIDTRTNSVIAVGAPDALRVVEAILLKLDDGDVRARKNSVYRLKNSPATNIAQSVTQFLTNQLSILTQDPNLISAQEQLEREVVVVAEPVSNSLLISATPRYYDDIMEIIKKLDEQPQQVMIQALIVEVELQDTDEFGVELGFQDSILFDRSILETPVTISESITQPNGNVTTTQRVISQSASPGFLFSNPTTPLGNNVGSGNPTNAVGTQGLSNFSLGRVNGDLGFGGLVLSASSESVSMLLRALAQNRQVRVLSRPSIQAMDNQPALIQQGQDVPVVDSVTPGTGLTPATPQIRQDQAGIILSVTPRITPDGNVIMSINAEKSQYNLAAGAGVPIFTDVNTGNVVESPVKDIAQAQTVISVPNGQTIVLGGLITSRTDNVHRRVPWLGDIPVLGWAFRYDFVQSRRTELLIFLTPRIITDAAYAEHIKEVEMARLHFSECEAEEMHGPLRGVPSEQQLFEGQLPSMQQYPQPTYPPPTNLESRQNLAPQPMMPTPVYTTPAPPQPMAPTPITTPPAAPAAQVAPQPLDPAPPQSQHADPQFRPAGGFEPQSSLDRRVIHAADTPARRASEGILERPASVKIHKSATAGDDPPSTIRLGKERTGKKSWLPWR